MALANCVRLLFFAFYFIGCTAQGTKTTSVLVSSREGSSSEQKASQANERSPTGPIKLAHKAPKIGDEPAYLLLMETRGEREQIQQNSARPPSVLNDSHSLQLEYRETPVGLTDSYQLELDALHYIELGRNPDIDREVEAGSDQLRIHSKGEEIVNVHGTSPTVDLTPRSLLLKPFASIDLDEFGNVVRYSSKGQRSTRRFLRDLPVRYSYAYSRVAFPSGPIKPGDSWTGSRFPPNATGLMGVKLEVKYTLAGYKKIDGVSSAWILITSDMNAENIQSASGIKIDRLVASMKGEAWLALTTGRIQRLVLEDSVRLSFNFNSGPKKDITNRLRYETRLSLSTRERGEVPLKWENGRERFGLR